MKSDDASYPSGHGARTMAFALILTELFPDQRPALIDYALETAWGRVQLGVHFPSDVVAGQILGARAAHMLLSNPDFRQQLDKVRRELAAPAADEPNR